MAYRFVGTDGELNVSRKGVDRAYLNDLYHWLIRLKWRYFLLGLSIAYLGINALFALIYWLCGGIHGTDGSYESAFSFSIQTVATIGYGAMYPISSLAHTIVAIESFTGLLFTAISTGLMFAKFSRPTARVVFSARALITSFDGQRALMFRAANMRGNQIVDATMNVFLARFEETEEGERFRRFYELELIRKSTSMFALTWSVIHLVTPQSPLSPYLEGSMSWEEDDIEIIVSLSGTDSTVGQSISARHSYTIDQIEFDARFVDIIDIHPDGVLEIDFSHFHDVEPLV